MADQIIPTAMSSAPAPPRAAPSPRVPSAHAAVVVVRGGDTYTFLRKSLVSKSKYFAHKDNFAELAEKEEPMDQSAGPAPTGGPPVYERVELPEEEVTDEALRVLHCFFSGGLGAHQPLPLSEANVYDVINAAMYLQVDELVTACVRFVKREKLIGTENFAAAWVMADRLGCRELQEHVEGGVVGPASHFARRRGGRRDFNLSLEAANLRLRCHQAVVAESTVLFNLVQEGKVRMEDGEGGRVVHVGELIFAGATAETAPRRLQALFHLINHLYGDPVDEIMCEVVPDLLVLAARFGVEGLKEQLFDVFGPQSADDWVSVYETARTLRRKDMLDRCLAHLCRNFSDFRPAIGALRADHLQTVLASDMVNATEGEILRALFTWVDFSELTRKQELRRLLQHIRVDQLSQADIDEAFNTRYYMFLDGLFSTIPSEPSKKRSWPKRLVMVEQPHPRIPIRREVRSSLGIHLYDFETGRWESHSGPGLRRRYSVSFDPAASRLFFTEPRNGIDVSVTVVSLAGNRPRKERTYVTDQPGAHSHSVSVFSPGRREEGPLIVTRMMPTKGPKAALFSTNLKKRRVTYEPVVYPAPEQDDGVDLPRGAIADAEKTEDRTYEVRALHHASAERTFVFSCNFRSDTAQPSNAMIIPDEEAGGVASEGRLASSTLPLQNTFSQRGNFEASFGAYEGKVARVGGWTYVSKNETEKTENDFKITAGDLKPRVRSRGEVDLFDAATLQHRKRLPWLVIPRDCCGVVEHEGALYVVGGFTRFAVYPSEKERARKGGKTKGKKGGKGRRATSAAAADPYFQFSDAVRHDAKAVRSMERFVPGREAKWEEVCTGPPAPLPARELEMDAGGKKNAQPGQPPVGKGKEEPFPPPPPPLTPSTPRTFPPLRHGYVAAFVDLLPAKGVDIGGGAAKKRKMTG